MQKKNFKEEQENKIWHELKLSRDELSYEFGPSCCYLKDFYENFDDLIPFLPKNVISILITNKINENSFLLLFKLSE